MLKKILNLLFPEVCGFCNTINTENLCSKCEENLKKYEIENIIVKNHNKKVYYDFLLCLFKYEGIIRDKIIEYKFKEKSYLYISFAKIILKREKICRFLENYDIIIPVPIHKKRRLERGYNQSELIAKELSINLKKEYCKNVLYKIKETEKQSLLNKLQRKENIKNAFKTINEDIIFNKKIILFDDIYTTGNTVNECSRVLKKAGAKEILVLTLAKD